MKTNTTISFGKILPKTFKDLPLKMFSLKKYSFFLIGRNTFHSVIKKYFIYADIPDEMGTCWDFSHNSRSSMQ